MRAGWSTFRQKQTTEAGASPDSAVAARTWLVRAALAASVVALLGTSQGPADPPTVSGGAPAFNSATYQFSRNVEGDSVDLTRDEPTASFMVTLRALELGPEGVQSTGDAVVTVTASLTTSDISSNPPPAKLRVGDYVGQEFEQSVTVAYPLVFQGTCAQPAENAPCQASFTVDFARSDDGAQNGLVHIDWSFELTSSGQVNAQQATTHPPQDPPWSVEITPQ